MNKSEAYYALRALQRLDSFLSDSSKWAKDAYAIGRDGVILSSHAPDWKKAACKICLEGGIRLVTPGRRIRENMRALLMGVIKDRRREDSSYAHILTSSIENFNDSSGTTFEIVKDVIGRAIQKARTLVGSGTAEEAPAETL